MSKIAVYVFLLFGISLALYLFGFTSPAMEAFITATGEGEVASGLMNAMLAIFTRPEFLALIGAAAVVAFVSGSSGDMIAYAFPIFMLIVFANFFILPTSFILSASIDSFSKIVVAGFLNLLLGLAIMEFVRSGN
jgi:hypothetical protein